MICSAIYFLFDHNTKYCTIYLCPHTVVATVQLLRHWFITSPVAVKLKVGHTHKKGQSREGEFLKKKVLITTGKRIENLSKANAVKEKVIHLDQLEFTNLSLLRTFNLDAVSTE